MGPYFLTAAKIVRLTKKRNKIITKALTAFRLIIDQCAADLRNCLELWKFSFKSFKYWKTCGLVVNFFFRGRNIFQKMKFVILMKVQLFHTSLHVFPHHG